MNPELWFFDLTPVGQPLFSLVPEPVHFLERRLAGAAALLAQPLLDVAETALEFAVSAPQRPLRIYAQVAADVDVAEQHIAELIGDLRRAGLFAESLAQLAELLVELVERAGYVGPFEADQRSPLAELVGARQRRQCKRHVGEHALAGAFALLPFLLLPRDCLRCRTVDLRGSKDVRMAPLQLVADCSDHVVERERALLARHLRVK